MQLFTCTSHPSRLKCPCGQWLHVGQCSGHFHHCRKFWAALLPTSHPRGPWQGLEKGPAVVHVITYVLTGRSCWLWFPFLFQMTLLKQFCTSFWIYNSVLNRSHFESSDLITLGSTLEPIYVTWLQRQKAHSVSPASKQAIFMIQCIDLIPRMDGSILLQGRVKIGTAFKALESLSLRPILSPEIGS